jgi:hypothetical protein
MPRVDATLVMVSPTEPVHAFTVMESADKQGTLDDLSFIPPDLLADMKPLLYPIEDYVADLMLLPGYIVAAETLDVYKKDGVSHIAVLSLPYEGAGDPWKVGADDFKLAFVVYYCESLGKYRLLHCTQCASAICGWLGDMQKEWGRKDAFGGAIQKNGQTYH